MRTTNGFTLLEITVTLAILGIVLIIVYGVFTRTLAGKEIAERRADEIAQVRATLSRLERDLQSAVSRISTGSPPTPRPGAASTPAQQRPLFLSRNHVDAGLPLDDLAFSAVLQRPAALVLSATDAAVVHYFVISDPADPHRRALLREILFSLSGQTFDPDAPNPAATSRILDGIITLEFRFFDGRSWIEEWDSTDLRNYAPLPQAVEISLGMRDSRGEVETFRVAVDIPMARASAAAPQFQRTPAPGTPTPHDGESQ